MASRNLSNSNISGSKNSTLYDESTQDGYEIIFTGTVTSGGASNIEFTNIPPTYKHLQIRGLSRYTTGSGGDAVNVQFNGDTGSNYTHHRSFASSGGFSNDSSVGTNAPQIGNSTTSGEEANVFSANIIDIVDYTGTQNRKTARSINGMDFGGAAGYAVYLQATWNNTNAITSIKLFSNSGRTFAEHTNFSLYGLRG